MGSRRHACKRSPMKTARWPDSHRKPGMAKSCQALASDATDCPFKVGSLVSLTGDELRDSKQGAQASCHLV